LLHHSLRYLFIHSSSSLFFNHTSTTQIYTLSLHDALPILATKTEFQMQYNSWYDNMMDITDESIKESFYGTEKELSKNGVEPLDAYVVDDGWNAYDNGSGSPYENKTGFWEFNDKFPNELYPASDMAEKFGSTFGLWKDRKSVA